MNYHIMWIGFLINGSDQPGAGLENGAYLR